MHLLWISQNVVIIFIIDNMVKNKVTIIMVIHHVMVNHVNTHSGDT